METYISKIPVLFLIVSAALCLFAAVEVTAKRECHSVLEMEDQDVLVLTFHNLTKSRRHSRACTIQVTAWPMRRLQLHLDYSPHARATTGCLHDYVHVGNEETKVNEESVTSFKFCNHIRREELVSRENYLWIVVSSKLPPDVLTIRITVHRPVDCPESRFECSPLQCVSRDQVCDGKRDCTNGRDEFCGGSLGQLGTKSEEECFRCMDGTCISPWFPRYSPDYGKALWYLCDGVDHCPDGSDERIDLCRRLPKDSEAVLRCVPLDSWDNKTEAMWASAVACDGITHCHDNQDELLSKCDRVNGEESRRMANALVFDPTAVALLVLAVLCLVVGGVLNYVFHRSRPQKGLCHSRNRSGQTRNSHGVRTVSLQPVPEETEQDWLPPEQAHLTDTGTCV